MLSIMISAVFIHFRLYFRLYSGSVGAIHLLLCQNVQKSRKDIFKIQG